MLTSNPISKLTLIQTKLVHITLFAHAVVVSLAYAINSISLFITVVCVCASLMYTMLLNFYNYYTSSITLINVCLSADS